MKEIVLNFEGFEGRKISELQCYIIKELEKLNVFYDPSSPLKKRKQLKFDLKFVDGINTSYEPISKIEIE